MKRVVDTEIKAAKVKLVTDGGMQEVTINEAMDMATQAGLNLVEMQPGDIPVCKLMDYHKYLFDQKKKDKEKTSKAKKIELKEVRMGPAIAEHDMEIKAKTAARILSEGDKVKLVMRHKGRENAFIRGNVDKLRRVAEHIEVPFNIDSEPVINGSQIIMVLSPE